VATAAMFFPEGAEAAAAAAEGDGGGPTAATDALAEMLVAVTPPADITLPAFDDEGKVRDRVCGA